LDCTSVIDIGCGAHRDPRAREGIDAYPFEGVTVVHDLTEFPWPLKDSSYERAVSHQCIEHLPSDGVAGRDVFFAFFDEVWRILKPGGTFEFDVPDQRSDYAYADPTHRRFYREKAFSFLWEPERDSLYPRKIWTLVDCHTDRIYRLGPLTDWHVRKFAPRLNRAICRGGIGTPSNIYVTIRKP
jgi:SAM-dependent methyltransferase